VNTFADATCDWQWIHTEPERAKKESPFGTHAHAHPALPPCTHLPTLTHTRRRSGGSRLPDALPRAVPQRRGDPPPGGFALSLSVCVCVFTFVSTADGLMDGWLDGDDEQE
jgi:hypothetical protein